MSIAEVEYRHVDVFAERRFSGNGLTVFPSSGSLTTEQMQAITIELRQFETIFLDPDSDNRRAKARVFTMEEELAFAGHPALGAAAVLHERFSPDEEASTWTLAFATGDNTLRVEAQADRFIVTMDQGTPDFGQPLELADIGAILGALGITVESLDSRCAPQVISTGLPYLIVPVRSELDSAQICSSDFETLLAAVGADFVYVLDTSRLEGRTWDNAGLVEDVATGSAAGPAAAYLVANELARAGDWFEIHQGAKVGRPSVMKVIALEADGRIDRVKIAGSVWPIARGVLDGL